MEENMEERKMYKATCSECGEECEVPFEPTQGKPVKCRECFIKSRPQRSFGGRRFGGRGFGGRGFNRPREMHKATCAECGKECEVPFRPTEGKPVYCKDCYAKRRESESEDF